MPLKKQLSPWHLWAIMVGMVISGEYFGWNFGFVTGGVWGLLSAALLVTIFYICFIFCCAELATALPHADGPSIFARSAMGPFAGYIVGIACLIEFVFAPPAIAVAIGQYLHFLIPFFNARLLTIIIFSLLIALNLWGAKNAARFEMLATILALLGLAIFYITGVMHFSANHLIEHAKNLPNNCFAAIPFAIWLYLAIEGGAMMTEELHDPKKNIPYSFAASIFTLVVCAFLTITLVASLQPDLTKSVDYPIPYALEVIYHRNNLLPNIVALLGIFGLVASLHGIIIGYSRQTFALARAGYLPAFLARLNRFAVPHWALIIPGAIGIICAASNHLSNVLIIISVFGAMVMYIMVMISYFVLQKKEHYFPSFRVPYKIMPYLALILGVVCLISITWYAIIPGKLTFLFWHIPIFYCVVFLLIISIVFYLFYKRRPGHA